MEKIDRKGNGTGKVNTGCPNKNKVNYPFFYHVGLISLLMLLIACTNGIIEKNTINTFHKIYNQNINQGQNKNRKVATAAIKANTATKEQKEVISNHNMVPPTHKHTITSLLNMDFTRLLSGFCSDYCYTFVGDYCLFI